MKWKLKKAQQRWISSWLVILLTGTSFVFWGIDYESLWYDEAYSAAMIRHSIGDIINLTSVDVHSPLYYSALHSFSVIFGRTELTLRMFSLLGLLALAGLGIGPIRRIWGELGGLLFVFLVFITPICSSMAQNVTMYTWACFLVTGCTLYAYLAMTENLSKDWMMVVIFGIFAVYIHVYALLEVSILFTVLFLWGMLRKRNMLFPLIVTSGIIGIGYAPWLLVLLKQTSHVVGQFWIPKPDFRLILQTLAYPFSDKFGWFVYPPLIVSGGVVAVILCSKAVIHAAIHRSNSGAHLIAVAITILIFTFVSTLILSWFVRPIFYPRYFFTCLGLYFLILVYGIMSLQTNTHKIVACLLFAVFVLPENIHFRGHRYNGPMFEAVDYVGQSLQRDDVFIHEDIHTFGTFVYYFPLHSQYFQTLDRPEKYRPYDVYAPNGIYGHHYEEFVKGKTVVWLVDRLGEGQTELNVAEVLENIAVVTGGEISYSMTLNQEFVLPYSWYQFKIIRLVRNDNTR